MAGYLTQDTLRLVALGLVCVVAISVGAATIQSIQASGGNGGGTVEIPINDSGERGPPGDDGGRIDGLGSNGTMGVTADLSWCAPFLPSTLGMLVYFGAFIGLLAFLKRRYSLGVAAFGLYGLSPIVLVAYFLSTDCATLGGSGPGEGGIRQAISDAASTNIAQPDVSPIWLVGILGIVLVATAAVILRSSSDQELDPVESQDDVEEAGTDVADLAAAAGAAADRLEAHNADVDNEVYRAWWEMTSLLDVPNPHSSTPGEFAEAAIEVGMGEDHVNELTRLFEEVRYGQRDAETRESRALDVFRSIEETYGRDASDEETEDVTDNNPVDSDSSDMEDTDGR